MDANTKAIVESIPVSSEAPDNPVALAFTNFSRKDLLRNVNGQLYGNWNPSFGGACIDPYANKYINQGSVISLREVGTCAQSGYAIVMAEHY